MHGRRNTNQLVNNNDKQRKQQMEAPSGKPIFADTTIEALHQHFGPNCSTTGRNYKYVSNMINDPVDS